MVILHVYADHMTSLVGWYAFPKPINTLVCLCHPVVVELAYIDFYPCVCKSHLNRQLVFVFDGLLTICLCCLHQHVAGLWFNTLKYLFDKGSDKGPTDTLCTKRYDINKFIKAC